VSLIASRSWVAEVNRRDLSRGAVIIATASRLVPKLIGARVAGGAVVLVVGAGVGALAFTLRCNRTFINVCLSTSKFIMPCNMPTFSTGAFANGLYEGPDVEAAFEAGTPVGLGVLAESDAAMSSRVHAARARPPRTTRRVRRGMGRRGACELCCVCLDEGAANQTQDSMCSTACDAFLFALRAHAIEHRTHPPIALVHTCTPRATVCHWAWVASSEDGVLSHGVGMRAGGSWFCFAAETVTLTRRTRERAQTWHSVQRTCAGCRCMAERSWACCVAFCVTWRDFRLC
jgi:hypothetical protein